MNKDKVKFLIGRYNGEKDARLAYYCSACEEEHDVNILREAGMNDEHPCWTFTGTLENPTLSPPVVIKENYNDKTTICHHHITNGQIIYADDCTHNWAGDTIDMAWVNADDGTNHEGEKKC